MTFSAIVFDLDGTLLDTLDDLADSMNAALLHLGHDSHPTAAYKIFVGDGVRKLAERALPEAQRTDAAKVSQCVQQMEVEYEKRWQTKTRLYDGIADMLTELVRRNIRLTILSNKQDALTQKVVAAFLAEWSWEIIRGAREGVPRKPHPQAAIDMLRELSLAPENTLYLGDTNTDMQTAVAAGMYPIGATWGFRLAAELTASGAKTLAHHPADVLALL